MKQSGTRITIILTIIKSIIFLYDVITIPFYFLMQKPWEHWKRKTAIYAKHMRQDDPYSPLIRIPKNLPVPFEGIRTTDDLFRQAVFKYDQQPCFGVREVFGEEDEIQPNGKVFKKLVLGDYRWLTYRQVAQRVENLGKGLLSARIVPKQKVVIFAETRIEWMLTALACFRNNIPIVTVYATLGPEGVIHAINQTEVSHVITSVELLPTLKQISSSIPKVNTIIYMEGRTTMDLQFPQNIKTISFSQLEKMGERVQNAPTVVGPGAEDLAVIMYTSGSTGVPKGVMITHKNVVTVSLGLQTVPAEGPSEDMYIAFLPLAHILEICAELYVMTYGVPVGYSSANTLLDQSSAIKRGCKGDVSILKPTTFGSVPLILDRIKKSILDALESKSPVMKAFFSFCVKYKTFWLDRGYNTPIMNRFIFKKVRDMFGGRVRYMFSGGAPLSPETQKFIRACLDVRVIQAYGLTETAAAATHADLDDTTTGVVGPPLEGIYIKLVDWQEGGYRASDKPHPRGEIVIGGDSITLGYFKNEELTNECYKTEDGIRWFYTGDIGQIEENGNIKIIDRKKDLVKLQFGEYISLGKVESELKNCPLVDTLCVCGNSLHTYVVALVVPDTKQLKTLATAMGKYDLSYKDLCKDSVITAQALKIVKEYGAKCKLQRTEIPQKIVLCPDEWSPNTGMMTAAFKLRRKDIEKFYEKEIALMYKEQ